MQNHQEGSGESRGHVLQLPDPVETSIRARPGGTVQVLGASFRLDVPPGALDQDTRIVLAPWSRVAQPDSRFALLLPGVDCGPAGTRFQPAATLTIRPALPPGVTLTDITIVRLTMQGSLEELPGTSRDTVAGTISAAVDHFTVFYAAYVGVPVGAVVGPSVSVGGPNLSPLFGTVGVGGTLPLVLRISGGPPTITAVPSGLSTDELFVQIDTANSAVNQSAGVDWVLESPAATGSGTSPAISFWLPFFGEIASGMRLDTSEPDGIIGAAFSAGQLYTRLQQGVPPGWSEGRALFNIQPDPIGNPGAVAGLSLEFDYAPPMP
jgi:hypothetical protein